MKTPSAVIERAKAGDVDAVIEWGANLWRTIYATGRFPLQPPEQPTLQDIFAFGDELTRGMK